MSHVCDRHEIAISAVNFTLRNRNAVAGYTVGKPLGMCRMPMCGFRVLNHRLLHVVQYFAYWVYGLASVCTLSALALIGLLL